MGLIIKKDKMALASVLASEDCLCNKPLVYHSFVPSNGTWGKPLEMIMCFGFIVNYTTLKCRGLVLETFPSWGNRFGISVLSNSLCVSARDEHKIFFWVDLCAGVIDPLCIQDFFKKTYIGKIKLIFLHNSSTLGFFKRNENNFLFPF